MLGFACFLLLTCIDGKEARPCAINVNHLDVAIRVKDQTLLKGLKEYVREKPEYIMQEIRKCK